MKELFFPLTGGNESDVKAGKKLIDDTEFSAQQEYLIMDRGYSCYEIHDICKDKGVEAVVPPKKNHKNPWLYNKNLYLYRNEIERLFGRIKNYRRISS